MKALLSVCLFGVLLVNCTNGQVTSSEETESIVIDLEFPVEVETIERSQDEWQSILSPEEYHVLREHGTERAFTGNYWDHKGTGYYVCAACQLPLFHSSTKYKSGTGWPSYYDSVDPDYVDVVEDRSFGMMRSEVVCARCGGHLGHVFEDGPRPTGLRYCINSVSLDFVASEREP